MLGLIGSGVSIWQANTAQQSVDATDKSLIISQRVEREAERSGAIQAKQTNDSLQASIENFHTQQRAWILASNAGFESTGGVVGDINVISPPKVILEMKNYGSSPALNVWTDMHGRLVGGKCGDRSAAISKGHSYSQVAPGEPIHLPNMWAPSVTQACIESLWDESAEFRIFGTVHYGDIFRKDHQSRICFQYDGKRSHAMVTCHEKDTVTN